MNIDYKITEVKPNVFAVIIKNDYDRAMIFCRVQEFYESPNPDFCGKHFSMWDYMKWYSEQYGRGFSYGSDWSGFNIPFDVLETCYRNIEKFETPYDAVMYKIYWQIQTMKRDGKAYVIGAGNTEGDTFQHEICHGLYSTNKLYKESVDQITIGIDWKDYQAFRNNLIEMGYTDYVVDDEIQAYLAFGHDYQKFSKGVNKLICKNLNKEYIKVFSNF